MTSKKELVSLMENSPSFTKRFHLPITIKSQNFINLQFDMAFPKTPIALQEKVDFKSIWSTSYHHLCINGAMAIGQLYVQACLIQL